MVRVSPPSRRNSAYIRHAGSSEGCDVRVPPTRFQVCVLGFGRSGSASDLQIGHLMVVGGPDRTTTNETETELHRIPRGAGDLRQCCPSAADNALTNFRASSRPAPPPSTPRRQSAPDSPLKPVD
jgi:hypothetical protein